MTGDNLPGGGRGIISFDMKSRIPILERPPPSPRRRRPASVVRCPTEFTLTAVAFGQSAHLATVEGTVPALPSLGPFLE